MFLFRLEKAEIMTVPPVKVIPQRCLEQANLSQNTLNKKDPNQVSACIYLSFLLFYYASCMRTSCPLSHSKVLIYQSFINKNLFVLAAS